MDEAFLGERQVDGLPGEKDLFVLFAQALTLTLSQCERESERWKPHLLNPPMAEGHSEVSVPRNN